MIRGIYSALLSKSRYALIAVIGCSTVSTTSTEDDSTLSQGLGNSNATYVVRVSGNDAYCDTDLFSGAHADAIQACIDRASGNGGGVVLVRAGTYSTGTWPLSLKANVTLMGEGQLSSKLAPTSDLGLIKPVQSNTTIRNLLFNISNLASGRCAVTFIDRQDYRDIKLEENLFFSDKTALNVADFAVCIDGADLRNIVIRKNTFRATTEAPHTVFHVLAGRLSGVRIEQNDLLLGGSKPTGVIHLQSRRSFPDITSGTGGSGGGSLSVPPADAVSVSNNTIRHTSSFHTVGIVVDGGVVGQIQGNLIEAKVGIQTDDNSQAHLGVVGNTVMARGEQSGVGHRLGKFSREVSFFIGNTDDRAATAANVSKIGRAAILVRAHAQADQQFTAGTPTALTVSAEDLDINATFDADTSTFTAPQTGWYHVQACARFRPRNTDPGDTFDVALTVDGTDWSFNRVATNGSNDIHSCSEDLLKMTAKSKLQATVYASGTATSRTISGSGRYSTFLNIERVSD